MQFKPNIRLYEEFHGHNIGPYTLQYQFLIPESPISVLHYHEVLEIGICHEGSGVFQVEQKIMSFSRGDVSIISAGEAHLAHSQRGVKSRWSFVFIDTPHILGAKFPEIEDLTFRQFRGATFPNIWHHREHPRISGLIQSIVKELHDCEAYSQTMLTLRLTELYIELHRYWNGAHEVWQGDAISMMRLHQIKPALEYVLHSYWKPVCLDEAARCCNMSTRNFTRVFKVRMGVSFGSYLARTRIAFACDQLLGTDKPMAVIADFTGFGNIGTFNRVFKRIMRTSPSRWRNNQVSHIHFT